MNALSLYLTTTRMVFQPTLDVDDSASWADINRLLVYLRQALTCCVCGCLLQVPMSSTISSCQHHVCKSCIGGKMRLKPSCSFCKDQSKFIENTQLRILLQSYRDLCDYISVAGVLERWGSLSSNGIVTQTNGNQGSSSTTSVALLGPANLLQLIEEGKSYSDKYKFSEPMVTTPSVKSKSPKSSMKGSRPSEGQINHSTSVMKGSRPSEGQINHSTSVNSEPAQSKETAFILNQSSVSGGQESTPLTGNQMSRMNSSVSGGQESIPLTGNQMSRMNGSTQNASSDAVKKFKPIEKKARMSRTVIPQPITATVLVDATPTPKSQPIQNPVVQDQGFSTVSNVPDLSQGFSTVSNVPDLSQGLRSQTTGIQDLKEQTTNRSLKSETTGIQDLKEQTKSQLGTVCSEFDSSHFASTLSNMVPKQPVQEPEQPVQREEPVVSLATVSSVPAATLVTNPVQVMSGQPRIVPAPVTKTQTPTAPKPLVPPSPVTASLKPLSPKTLVPSCPKTLVPSCPKTLVPSCPKTLVPSCPKTLVPSCSKTLVPSCPVTGSPNPPPSPGKSKSKRRGCRCGLATPTPGKLTCCGQRCPCYVDGKGCYDCKCRGCRNPHHANTTPGIMVTPAVKPAPVPTTTATIRTILAGQNVPVTKSFGGDNLQTSLQVMRPITTIGSCQLLPIPSPGTGTGTAQIMVTQKAPNLNAVTQKAPNPNAVTQRAPNPNMVTQKAPNPNAVTQRAPNPKSNLLFSSIVSNPSLTLTSTDPTPSTFSFFPMGLKGQVVSSHSTFNSSNQPIMITTHPVMTSQSIMASQSCINQTNQTLDHTSTFNEPLTLPLTMDDLTIGSNDDDPTKMAESNFMIDDHISMM